MEPISHPDDDLIMANISLNDIQWDYLSDEGSAWMKDLRGSSIAGEAVKVTSKRRVLRLQGKYLKEVHYSGVTALLKSINGGTACKEGRISRELAERGIAAPEVLGFGKAMSKGRIRRDVLLTREVLGKSVFVYLNDVFPALAFSGKRKFIRSFAVFVRKLHDAGALHADLHVGNIFLTDKGDKYHFVLLDNDRLSLSNGQVSNRRRIKNLALLLANLRPHMSRTHYLRFLREYGLPPGSEGRALLSAVEKRVFAHSMKIWRGKGRQCLTNNRRFSWERKGDFTIYHRKKFSRNLIDVLLPDPDVVLERGEIFKAGRTVRAARIEIDGQSYFLKRYNCKGFIYRLRNAFRRSRAVRTWRVSWGFRVRGIPVPEPIACFEERRWRLLGRSYILSAFIPESEPLTTFWTRMGKGDRKEMLARLGSLLGRMHRFGCLHGDLKWNNILVSAGGGIVLTDLDGSRCSGRTPPAKRIRRDLNRFERDLSERKVPNGGGELFFAVWRRWVSPLGLRTNRWNQDCQFFDRSFDSRQPRD